MKQKIKTCPIVRFNFQMFDLTSNSVYLFLFWNLVLDEEKAFWPFATNFQFWNVDLKYLSQQTNKLFKI